MVVIPDCPACRVTMVRGFVLDKSQNSQELLRWIEGAPEKSRWGTFATKGRAAHDVVAYRCPRCAWVIWFAPDVGGS